MSSAHLSLQRLLTHCKWITPTRSTVNPYSLHPVILSSQTFNVSQGCVCEVLEEDVRRCVGFPAALSSQIFSAVVPLVL
ncbi:hypothetical protein QQF64_002872 [Cirrhinus molitorella]|uniref:Uncharacterized protein n=1 Tax=Cirrhinus molitorella TaxID=172907 RepID=A0ABR3MRC6_9TELE